MSHIRSSREVLHSSKSSEWYTPTKYVEAARRVLGSIELDPASCEFANRVVKAAKYFTEADGGLSRQWHDNVFLNPPYGKTKGKSNQGIWFQKLLAEFQAGRVEYAIMLVNATPGNAWFYPLWSAGDLCFTNHRIEFYSADSVKDDPTHSNCFLYLRATLNRRMVFVEEFRPFGRIIMPVCNEPNYSICV